MANQLFQILAWHQFWIQKWECFHHTNWKCIVTTCSRICLNYSCSEQRQEKILLCTESVAAPLVNGSRNNNFFFKVNLDKYTLVYWQIHLLINGSCNNSFFFKVNFDRYSSLFGQIHSAISTNTFAPKRFSQPCKIKALLVKHFLDNNFGAFFFTSLQSSNSTTQTLLHPLINTKPMECENMKTASIRSKFDLQGLTGLRWIHWHDESLASLAQVLKNQ